MAPPEPQHETPRYTERLAERRVALRRERRARARPANPGRYGRWLVALAVVFPIAPLGAVSAVLVLLSFGEAWLRPAWAWYAALALATLGTGVLLQARISDPRRSRGPLLAVLAHFMGAALTTSCYLGLFLFMGTGQEGPPFPRSLDDVVAGLCGLVLVPAVGGVLGLLLGLPALPVTWLAIGALHRASGGPRTPPDVFD